MNVYAILVNGELFPNYYNTYKEALDEVKNIIPDWDDRYDEDGKYNQYLCPSLKSKKDIRWIKI